MKISVIVPVYNVSEYLEQCLDSIINQDYDDYEIICVNDGSTDNSYEILESYKDKVIIINNSTNSGLSYSRNVGLENASGDYILFVDSDDYIENNTLNILNDAVKRFPSVDIINFQKIRVYDGKYKNQVNTQKNKEYNTFYKEQDPKEWLKESQDSDGLIIGAWSRIYSRNFLMSNNLRFYNRLLYEDQLFLIQCVRKANSVVTIPDRLYYYRKRENSIMDIVKEEELDSRVVALNAMLAMMKDCVTSDERAVIKKFVDINILPRIEYLFRYFPSRERLMIGDEVDQYLFDILKRFYVLNKSNRYICLKENEISDIKKYDKVLVFGAGKVGLELIENLKDIGVRNISCIVSRKNTAQNKIADCMIYQIDEFIDNKDTLLVIIGVLKENESIQGLLKSYGFGHIMKLDCLKK